jgi:hypothetical protein
MIIGMIFDACRCFGGVGVARLRFTRVELLVAVLCRCPLVMFERI